MFSFLLKFNEISISIGPVVFVWLGDMQFDDSLSVLNSRNGCPLFPNIWKRELLANHLFAPNMLGVIVSLKFQVKVIAVCFKVLQIMFICLSYS